jgi:uncharacterized protein
MLALSPSDLATWEPQFERFLVEHAEVDAAHDLAHVRRVVAAAKRLTHAEGARLDVVLPAAWLHDCVIISKDHPERHRASSLAAEAAVAFLRDAGYPTDLLPAVAHAVEAHSFSAGVEPQTVEAAVVQDADRLDALGAIGIARTFAVGGALGAALYNPADPFPTDRSPDDRSFVVDHFYAKLLGLADTMRTAAGRAEAERRTDFLRAFLDQLRAEIADVSPRPAPAD